MHRRLAARMLVPAIVAGLAMVASASPVSAGTAPESDLLGMINSRRVAMGKNALNEHGTILAETRGHSDAMADRRKMGHFGFQQRAERIRNADGGIGFMCENVAYARGYPSTAEALRAIYRGWRRSDGHRKCMFDQYGHRTRSAAVGLELRGNTWWATFITAQDST